MNSNPPVIFALDASRALGEKVAAQLGVTLGPHEARDFEDGEHKIRPLASVRGRDVYVVHSLYGDPQQSVNDKLCRLLFFLGALRDASAARVTAVTPYLCYARKDRRSKPRDPLTTRYIAELFEAVGVDRVVTLDVHNLAAFQNAFRIRTEHLEARALFVAHFAPLIAQQNAVVVSPDAGGVKRADEFRQALERGVGRPVPMAFAEKYRSEGVVSGSALIGDVAGRVAIVIDDLISSGTTLARAAENCRAHGAVKVYAAATHGVFTGQANEVLGTPAIEHVVVTDTIPPFRLHPELLRGRIAVLDISPLLAASIRHLHADGADLEPARA